MAFAQFGFAASEVVDGVTWYYSTYTDGGITYAQITSGADKYSGNLTVPATLGGYQVRRIGDSAFYECSGLTGITLPTGVVGIDIKAFGNCVGLLNVSLPNTLTYIWTEAFYGCSSLASVVIPDSVTSMGKKAFYNCTALLSVTLSRNLTSISESCFDGCFSLTSILFPSRLTSIGSSAFVNCYALADVTFPNGLMSIGNYAFTYCRSLTRFDIPSTVNSIGTDIISGCYNLKTITVAAGNIDYKEVNNCLVTYSGSTLLAVPCGCATVDIPQGVTAIPGGMFYNDDNLLSVTIPQGVTSIGSSGFSSCNSLTQVSLPDGLTLISANAFKDCDSIAEIILPASVTTVGTQAFTGGNSTSRRVILLGAPPSGIVESGLLSSSNISYPREHGEAWLEILNNISRFTGYNQPGKPEVEYVSVAVRESDPTILDVTYRVKSVRPTVKVRALAFKDGVRSFANVVRPETFIEGTEVNVGDAISANVAHKLTWRVSSDWQIDLAKVKFEVLAVEENLLPLEIVTIPANGTNRAMEISWNAINNEQVFDALLWHYADKTAGLTLENGVLKEGGNIVGFASSISLWSGRSYQTVNGVRNYYNFTLAPSFVFSKMGYATLTGDALTYANSMTRLGLSPSGVRQYAYRWIDAE